MFPQWCMSHLFHYLGTIYLTAQNITCNCSLSLFWHPHGDSRINLWCCIYGDTSRLSERRYRHAFALSIYLSAQPFSRCLADLGSLGCIRGMNLVPTFILQTQHLVVFDHMPVILRYSNAKLNLDTEVAKRSISSRRVTISLWMGKQHRHFVQYFPTVQKMHCQDSTAVYSVDDVGFGNWGKTWYCLNSVGIYCSCWKIRPGLLGVTDISNYEKLELDFNVGIKLCA